MSAVGRRTRVGINGFGRIGRSVFRILAERADIEVVVINDLFENEQLAYLLKYDTMMRVFPSEVTSDADALYVDGRQMVMTGERDPAAIPWGALEVDIVVESTGVFTGRQALEKHLAAGAKKVILTVPASDEIDATIVMGVNDGTLRPGRPAGVERLLHHQLPGADRQDPRRALRHRGGVRHHRPRLHQRPAPGRRAAQGLPPQPRGGAEHHPDDDRRGARGGGGAAAAEGKARRHGDARAGAGRLDRRPGLPPAGAAGHRRGQRRGARGGRRGRWRGSSSTARCRWSPPTSSATRTPRSSTPSRPTSTGDGYVKVVAWYDNEWGYSNRVVDLIGRMMELGAA